MSQFDTLDIALAEAQPDRLPPSVSSQPPRKPDRHKYTDDIGALGVLLD